MSDFKFIAEAWTALGAKAKTPEGRARCERLASIYSDFDAKSKILDGLVSPFPRRSRLYTALLNAPANMTTMHGRGRLFVGAGRCVYRKLASAILVVKATENRV